MDHIAGIVDCMSYEFKWLDGSECVDALNPILDLRGMSLLNEFTSRALAAYQDGELIMALVLQLHPVLGPLVRTDNFKRDNGELSRELTERMHEFMAEVHSRDCMVICDSPITERLAQRHGMTKLESPVYMSGEVG